jgi:DNA topoisomerase-3
LEKQNLTYYKIYIKLKSDEHVVKIYLNKDYKDFREVRKIINGFRKERNLIINNLIEDKRKKEHPPGLNTANMLKMSSTYLGISPQATMNIAEKLYTRGYISYPRTETTQYASSFDFVENLNEFIDYSTYGNDVSELIDNFEEDEDNEDDEYDEDNESSFSREGYDAGDHPPITPARKPEKGELRGKDLELFNLICQYYFASLSQDLEYDNLTYEFEIDGIKYTSSCSLIQNEGFLKFLPYQKKEFIDKEDVLEPYKAYKIVELDYEEREIDSYITEAELIEEMEKNHIGTDASMSVHIQNIVRRGYVRVDEKRRLIPTSLGKALIEALEAVEPDIVLPKNRATIEEFVSLLSEGKKEYNEVLDYALKFYKSKYISVASQIGKLIKIFGKYFKMKNQDLPKKYYY